MIVQYFMHWKPCDGNMYIIQCLYMELGNGGCKSFRFVQRSTVLVCVLYQNNYARWNIVETQQIAGAKKKTNPITIMYFLYMNNVLPPHEYKCSMCGAHVKRGVIAQAYVNVFQPGNVLHVFVCFIFACFAEGGEVFSCMCALWKDYDGGWSGGLNNAHVCLLCYMGLCVCMCVLYFLCIQNITAHRHFSVPSSSLHLFPFTFIHEMAPQMKLALCIVFTEFSCPTAHHLNQWYHLLCVCFIVDDGLTFTKKIP